MESWVAVNMKQSDWNELDDDVKELVRGIFPSFEQNLKDDCESKDKEP